MKTNIKLHAWGVRGSAPRSGQRFREYGGNTSCWSLELEAEKRMIVFDAGLWTLMLFMQKKLWRRKYE